MWCGVVWRGVAWRGVAWRGVAWRGVAWRGVAWRGVAWRGVMLYMFVQVLTKGPVTVSEGGDVEYIELSATLPPRFICATSETLSSAKGTCEITVFGFLGIESGDKKCLDGTSIPQAVLGWPHSYGDDIIVPCGVKVTESNWLRVLRLAVKAKMDLTKDTNYTRKLTISQKVSVGTVQITTDLRVVEVGVFSRSVFPLFQLHIS